MSETTEGAEATSAEAADAEATPDSEQTETEEDKGEEQKSGAHFSDAYEDKDVKSIAARYNTEEAMAKALKEANTQLSQRLKMPGKDASEDDIAAFHKQLGVPEDISGYDLKKPDFMDEAEFKSETMQNAMNGIIGKMHEAGASKSVVSTAVEAYWEMERTAKEITDAGDVSAAESAEAVLRKKWLNNYDSNIAFAESVVDEYPDLAKVALRDGTLMGSSPHYAEMLAEFGRLRAEGPMQAGFSNSEAGTDARSEFDRLTREMHDAHGSGDKTKAQSLEEQRRKISEQLHGTGSISGQELR